MMKVRCGERRRGGDCKIVVAVIVVVGFIVAVHRTVLATLE